MIRASSSTFSIGRVCPTARPSRRRAMSILEVVVACILVSALISLSAQLLRVISSTQRDSQRRETAVQEATSALERITVIPWGELTNEKLAGDAKLVPSLPDGKLKVQVDEVPAEQDAKRITVEVDWRTPQAMRASPVRLSAWVYRRGQNP